MIYKKITENYAALFSSDPNVRITISAQALQILKSKGIEIAGSKAYAQLPLPSTPVINDLEQNTWQLSVMIYS